MPLSLADGSPVLLIRRPAFERVGLARATIDERFALTPEDFRVEGDLIVIGPLFGEGALTNAVRELEDRGLVYFEDLFDLSGLWPEWLRVFVAGRR